MTSDAQPTPRPAPSAGSRGTSLLGSLARLTADTLPPMLDSMFSACDDNFFDLASRAKSNQEQNLYFESLREIRAQKKRVVEGFASRLAEGFARFESRTMQRKRAAGRDQTDLSSIELVAMDQMERDVLVIDMVAKARQEFQQELFQLNQRMLAIVSFRFEPQDNPLDPGAIAAAFTASSDVIDIELSMRKILYTQFDQLVIRKIDGFYYDANQLLIEARILPDLKSLMRRNARTYPVGGKSGKPAPAAEKEQEPSPFASAPGMHELGHLLQRLRSGGVRLPMFPGLPPEGAAPQLPKDELLSLLSDVQLRSREPGETAEPLDIRAAVNAIIASRGQFTIGRADEDVINVVAMFFDLILDDSNLPIEIQALISRLQLPILKVALKDHSFFTSKKHPARQLINQIARTSVGWESSDKDDQDALFIRLTELVEEVLGDSADHVEMFEKCLADLTKFVERSEQKAAKVEQRTSERLQAEARNAAANDIVHVVLNERLEGKELPAALSSFLVEDWQQVLRLMYLRHGKDSPEWMDAVQSVDDILWSVQKHSDEKSLARLERLLPDLYGRMAKALETTCSTPEEARGRIEAIKQVHRHIGEGAVEEVAVRPLTEEQQQKISVGPTEEEREKAWADMTAVERQKVQFEALQFEYLRRVDETPIGTWFLYDDLRRDVTRRCRLSTRLEETRIFIFVNRLGVKVYEKPRKAFAYDLQMGHARPIEDAPLFDRTIERIASNLRKLAGEG